MAMVVAYLVGLSGAQRDHRTEVVPMAEAGRHNDHGPAFDHFRFLKAGFEVAQKDGPGRGVELQAHVILPAL